LSELAKIWLISWAGFLFIRAIGATLRYKAIIEPGCIADSYGAGPPAIWCFWHRAVIPATYRFRNKGLAVMTSRSFDGEYIARIIQKLGFAAVRGSSSRGAVGALIGMRQQLEQGHGVVFLRGSGAGLDLEFMGPDDYSQAIFTGDDLRQRSNVRATRCYGRADVGLASADAEDTGAVQTGGGSGVQIG
jgi:hypothetical protein